MPSLSLALKLGSCILSGGAYDADALAYFARVATAGYTMTVAEKNAVNSFISSLKGASVYTKVREMYLFIGAAAGPHALGFKNVSNLTFFGSPTHDTNGVTPNGTTQYASTTINPSLVTGFSNNNHYGFYTRTSAAGSASNFNIGVATNADTGTDNSGIVLRRTGDAVAFDAGTFPNGRASTTATDGSGMFVGSVIAATDKKLYRNGSQIASQTTAHTQVAPNGNIFLFAINNLNTAAASFFGLHQCAFACIGDGLSSTEAGNLASAVNTLQTALSRNVY